MIGIFNFVLWYCIILIWDCSDYSCYINMDLDWFNNIDLILLFNFKGMFSYLIVINKFDNINKFKWLSLYKYKRYYSINYDNNNNNYNKDNNNNNNLVINSDNNDNSKYNYNNNDRLIISFENRFGHYYDYLNQSVTLEFMVEYYPDYIDNELFIYFINQLPPSIRLEKDSISKLFYLIIHLNSVKDKLMVYTSVLPKESLLKIFKEFNIVRKDIQKILENLLFSNNDINKLLINLSSKLNSKVLNDNIDKNHKDKNNVKYNDIEFSEEFIDMWFPIYDILSKDKFKLSEDIINKDKELFIDIFNLIQFCINNKIGNINSVNKFAPLNEFINYLENMDKSKLSKNVKTKKGIKEVGLGPGAIHSNIKFGLMKIKTSLENLIINSILNVNSEISNNLISDVNQIKYEYEKSFNEDFKYLLDNYIKALNIVEFLYSIGKDLSDSNIESKCNKLIEYIHDLGMNMDDLYYATNLINYSLSSENILISKRQNSLSMDSNFFLKCNEIINDSNIKDDNHKQLILERFILSYEKEFILNLISNIENSSKNYKLVSRIYKHSTTNINNRIQAIIEQHLKKNLELYNKNKNDYGKLGDNLALALFLVLKSEDVINILFAKVIKIIGKTNGVKQVELIGELANEMCITFKYNSNLKKLENELDQNKLTIVKDVKDNFDILPIDSKLQFGYLLFNLLLSEFSYIFKSILIKERDETHIYITISEEYLAVLSGVMFNYIKLPMLCKPKEWDSNSIGGYLLDEFNDLNKNNEIIRSNPYLKIQSSVSIEQMSSINFLNNIAFEINKSMLNYLILEWKNDNSLIFKNYNKLHPLTNNIYDNENKIDSNTKLDIIRHNSLYWNYSNIINIAILMKNSTFYLPTFLDFRGRIYPTTSYLSYQGGDLARSLLLFKNVDNKVKYNKNVEQIFDNTINKKLIINKLNDIDYVKLYISNVYGLNKLNRKNRIKWFDNNISDIIDLFENNIDLFNIKYLINAKEPAQFISSLFEYKKYINKEISDIKTPILFDATCSGIQHLSALTTDLDISKLVNLIESIKDEPSDFYNFCIENINNNIKNLPESDFMFKSKLMKLDLNRKMLKHSIMTVPYNVTFIGISDKIAESFEKKFIDVKEATKLESNNIIKLSDKFNKVNNIEKNNINSSKVSNNNKGIYIYIPSINIIKLENQSEQNNIIFTQNELNKLGAIIRQTVLSLIPPFVKLKNYFDDMVDLLKILDLPIYWETPSNMIVSMSLMKMNSKKIKSKLLKSSKPISILLPSDELNYRSIKTGLMPNFIHSLDASNIHLLIKEILLLKLNKLNLYTIHDCFATDCKNMAILELLVKKSFSDIYFNEDYLKKVHNSFLNQINSTTTIFDENTDTNIKKYILIDSKLIKGKNKNLIFNKLIDRKFIKYYLPELTDFNWTVNKEIIRKEIMFNQYFIS